MTAVASTPPRHVVSRAVAAAQSKMAEVSEASLWLSSPGETGEALVELGRLGAMVAELELRVAEHAHGLQIGEGRGATSTASWWAHATRQVRPVAHRKMRLALALGRYERLRAALAGGAVLLEQAYVIAEALEALPGDLPPATRAEAEAGLVRFAGEHDARALRILGRRILDVVDPAAGEAAEAARLAEEERAAAARTRFTMAEDGHGCVRGRFTLPVAVGAMLRKALLALAAPRHVAATDGTVGQRRPAPERMGAAFAQYVERYPAERLPAAGGVAATVVVTMGLATLLGGRAAASLDTGERISADTARRWACEAGIIPAVLGGASQVLDLGRRRRFHTEAQRIALGLEQGGCTAQGCDWPPGMCHAHHEDPWGRHGGTSVRRGRLLCPRHHARAHDPAFTTTQLPGGKVAFHRRP
jgi:hypothetical protein